MSRGPSRERSAESAVQRIPMVVAVRCRALNHRERCLGASRFPNRGDTNYCSVVEVNSSSGTVGVIDPDNVGQFSCNLLASNTVTAPEPNESFTRGADREYTFDLVFDPSSSNEEVYTKTVAPLVQCVREGYNGTCFAYGMTGAGKTYTMSGTNDEKGNHIKGLCSLAIDDIFPSTMVEKRLPDEHTTNAVTTTVYASYLELYNEKIRDLLVQATSHKSSSTKNPFNASQSRRPLISASGGGQESEQTFDVVEDKENGIHVPGLVEVPVQNSSQLEKLIAQGSARRTKATTSSNAVSSRSHAILQLTVKQRFLGAGPDGKDRVRSAKLSLIDLAGSERATAEIISIVEGNQPASQQKDLRRREGANINRSLLALGNCITVLGNMSLTSGAKRQHIPYRDSKLTRLLKESLGGNTRTVMIASITPSCLCFEETLSTLKYATRAKAITRKVQKNAVVTVEDEESAPTTPIDLQTPNPDDVNSMKPRGPLYPPVRGESVDEDGVHPTVLEAMQRQQELQEQQDLRSMIYSLHSEVSSLKAQLFVTQQTNERLGRLSCKSVVTPNPSGMASGACSTISIPSRVTGSASSVTSSIEDVELSCLTQEGDVEAHKKQQHQDPFAPRPHPSQILSREKMVNKTAPSSSVNFMLDIREQLDAMILTEANVITPAKNRDLEARERSNASQVNGPNTGLKAIQVNKPPERKNEKLDSRSSKSTKGPAMTTAGREMLKAIAQRTGTPELLRFDNIE